MNHLEIIIELNREYIHMLEDVAARATLLNKMIRFMGKNGEEASLFMSYEEGAEFLRAMADEIKKRFESMKISEVKKC